MPDKVKSLVGRAPRAATSSPTSATAASQRRFADVGLSGDLSRTPYDYIGVFTQNLNGSKTDYWQHRERRPRTVAPARRRQRRRST